MHLRLALLSPLLLATACAHFPENLPLDARGSARDGYRFENLPATVANTDSVLVCLSLSGGGMRASALAYGVVQGLAGARIQGGTRRLLDEVDILSSTSGGSFAAAYLGVFGADAFLADFRARVLSQDVGEDTFWRGVLCPYHLVRLWSPWFSRSELASELYAGEIFGDITYRDLQRRGRPFVVLNATDLALGMRFEFTQDRFDELASSLAHVKVARAVAASSAFPVLLTPLAFRDFSKEERYVHVIDGGLVDNRGLGYVLDAYQRGAIRALIAAGKVETLVFVVVNARGRPIDEVGASSRAPTAGSVLDLGLCAAIDRRGEDQGLLLADLCLRGQALDGAHGPAVHLIEIDLDDLPDAPRRERLLRVETTTGLPPEVVEELVTAGAELLAQSDAFARVKAALR